MGRTQTFDNTYSDPLFYKKKSKKNFEEALNVRDHSLFTGTLGGTA